MAWQKMQTSLERDLLEAVILALRNTKLLKTSNSSNKDGQFTTTYRVMHLTLIVQTQTIPATIFEFDPTLIGEVFRNLAPGGCWHPDEIAKLVPVLTLAEVKERGDKRYDYFHFSTLTRYQQDFVRHTHPAKDELPPERYWYACENGVLIEGAMRVFDGRPPAPRS